MAKTKNEKRPKNLYYAKVLPKLEIIKGWYRNGADDNTVASNLNIGRSTYALYKSQYDELYQASLEGKEEADIKVESALYKRAIGYTVTLKEEKLDKNGDVRVLEKDMHVPGDTTAQIFWLKNRLPKQWRDKQESIEIASVDDGFVDALNSSAEKDWEDEE